MARSYTMTRRAERQAETRRRIVEAAVELHSTLGPAQTTVAAVAERAGVQRHTFYAHFPDERSLTMACSGLALERDPLPEAGPWRKIADPRARLETGLGEVYGWYGRNADLAGCVLRDAEHHVPTAEIVALRLEPTMRAWGTVLGRGLKPRQRALLHLALDFHTWRTITREAGLSASAAVETMAGAILGAGPAPTS